MLIIQETSGNSQYEYTPSLPFAIVGAAMFGVGGIIHVIILSKLHAKYFIPFAIGCFMESVGYGGRIWGHYNTISLASFITQALLILISPALFAASIYMVLGRIIAQINGERHSLIRLEWLTKIFVSGDCVSFLVQAVGGGIESAGTLQLMQIGQEIIVAGLFIQIFFFGLFILTTVTFHLRILRNPSAISNSLDIPWRRNLGILYLSSSIILVRSTFRIVEYLMGKSGFPLQHEYMLYIFDTLLMLAVVSIFIWRHPAKALPRSKSIQSDGRPEAELPYDDRKGY